VVSNNFAIKNKNAKIVINCSTILSAFKPALLPIVISAK
jgi:hypothetical protein